MSNPKVIAFPEDESERLQRIEPRRFARSPLYTGPFLQDVERLKVDLQYVDDPDVSPVDWGTEK